MLKVDPGFKATLSTVESAGELSYCYQCSSCVAECPAAQRFPEFNPREIVLASLLGVAEYLTAEGSVIWQCATCYNCYERCPQGTHPVEVITALKNIAFDSGNAPENVSSLREAVMEHGTVIAPSDTIRKRRDELGLPELPDAPAEDMKKIMGRGGG
ncbi:MAG: 4Fe-4S dicluster domain-containing protein [Actinobacteria bacterium]|nr:4Fe-4S dicluster domain-containing protein [Actinomycetota bacterium]MCG2817718.1 4Fe-4S dicluster domain-containing protein [Actinomycetes bacterium]MBU4217510.1 4Fe-4S dicluster domain-containing protein [Actinomycetota bacterium]MBU4358215.1 4Fe-4S dicluster domain-containing protein [Actinomycetota bacterium]MBU4392605.1 4Fe-4S dicluster domain-containing protein [Actinomycetota bacterium]